MPLPTSHPYAFDPTHGYDRERLLAVAPPEAPPDFDAFWQARYDRARAVDPRPELRQSPLHHPDWQVWDIAYRSTGDFTIQGWLLLPAQGAPRRGLVVGHGYGGRDGPDFTLPVTDTAVLFPCCRGLSRSARPPISTESTWHVLHDIDKRDAYILGGCVEDTWLAVSALLALYPALEGRIGYSGISFGGGVGALALPWDARIGRGELSLPSFGHQKLRLALPSVGSAASVQEYQRRHGSPLATLRYYDAATAAARIRVPMLLAPALFDPAVPPPCQFAICNAIPNCKELFILDAGHFDYPGQEEQAASLRQRFALFFGSHEPGISSLA